ncbi:MAG TPA: HlyD family secretion protein [Sphingomonas sp.]|nr:HlyD family secretion protein [Sphingomonas sp.]
MNDATAIDTDTAIAVSAPRRPWWRLPLMFGVPLLIIAIGLFFWLTSGHTVSTDNALVDAPVSSVAPEVTGRIVDVRVKENDVVKAGQLLFTIDPAPFRIAVLQAEAALATARVNYAQLQGQALARGADVGSKQADVAANHAATDLARENLSRQASLLKRGFTTRAAYDAAQAAFIKAREDEAASGANIMAARAQAQAANAMLGTGGGSEPPAVAAARAQLERARLDLARTEVRAPMAGRITQTDRLEPGNLAPQQLPIISIVADRGYWIEANFKETQLAKIRPGQSAEVEIDAVPGRKFAAHVTSIGAGTGSQFSLLPAQNATGNWVKVTQRVPVRLVLDEKPDRPLVAGWSANVTVRVKE